MSENKKAVTDQSGRKRKSPRYASFKLQRRIKHPKGRPPGVKHLLEKTFGLLWALKKPLLGLVVVFALLNLVFVRNFSAPINVEEVRSSLQESLGDSSNILGINTTIFGLIIGSGTALDSEASALYQGVFVLLFSLALVWLFRQHSAGTKTTTKMALYRSTYPLVPTVLVLLTIGLQLLPVIVVSSLFEIVINSGIAASGLEQAIWVLLLFLSGLLSFYMISSSIFALYIVMLPDMTPMKALRSARQLVVHRRLSVMLRLIWLPVVMLVILAGIMLPAIFFVGFIAPWLYFGLSLFGLPFLHAYAYSLYRELL